jgi:hypothetical protein
LLAAVAVLVALPMHAGDPPDALLERIEAIRQAGRRAAAELWPGWDPLATPLAIHKRSELGVLVGHPKPPAGFRRFATTLVSAPVFVADGTPGMAMSNTAAEFGGVITSFLGFQELMERPTVAEAAALGIHELFHAHQKKIAPRKHGNILVALWGRYPEFSARNRALLNLEAEALHSALLAGDSAEQRRHAADFLGLRAERRKEMSAEVVRYESGEESSEGLAHYIEYRLLEAAFPEERAARDKLLEDLTRLGALPHDRQRFYVLGMAEGLLLDRLRSGWKKEFETSPALLDELLARAAPPASHPRDLNSLLAAQEAELARKAEEGSRRLGLLLAKGRRVSIEIEGLRKEIGLRGLNPNGIVQLSPDHVAHTYLLLDLKGEGGAAARLEFSGIPVIYEKLQDILWCSLPDDAVEAALARLADAPEKLVIKGQGFLLELTQMEVNQRGKELRVRPSQDLVRKAPLEKPKFIKP